LDELHANRPKCVDSGAADPSIQRARGSLLWERLWPAIAVLATGSASSSLFPGPACVVLPRSPRHRSRHFRARHLIAGSRSFRLRVPNQHDGLRRLDRGSGRRIGRHTSPTASPATAKTRWRRRSGGAHVERALMAARRFKAGWPSPKLSVRDPMALRALILLLVVTTRSVEGRRRRRL